MPEKKPAIAHLLVRARRLIRESWGLVIRSCLCGILVACVYNFLFLNYEIGALAEHSMSEEKATYGIRTFAQRIIVGAVFGALAGLVLDIYRMRK